MGFQKPINYDYIIEQLAKTSREIASPYNDGFTGWALKQELYAIKYFLDEALNDLPKFSDEEQFLAELHKKKMWKKLKR